MNPSVTMKKKKKTMSYWISPGVGTTASISFFFPPSSFSFFTSLLLEKPVVHSDA